MLNNKNNKKKKKRKKEKKKNKLEIQNTVPSIVVL
jgi:hypothetical protein